MFDEQGEIAGYRRKVVKMMREYDDLVFWLSQNSNESIMDIKKMTHGEKVGFQTRLIKHIQDKQKGSNRGSEEELD